MKSDIQLVTMTPGEAESMLKDLSYIALRQFVIVPGALPPDIIFISALERLRAGELWFWCAPQLFCLSSENRIVGSGCFKNSPRDGTVEIGCGVAEPYRGRNIATKGVELLVAEGFLAPEVVAITAETAVWNSASQRVLEKASFFRLGWRIDTEDGLVIKWRRDRTA